MLNQINRCSESVQEQTEFDGEPEPIEENLANNVPIIMSTDDVEFEMELAQDDESNELAFIVNKNEIKYVVDENLEVVHIDEDEIDGMYILIRISI